MLARESQVAAAFWSELNHDKPSLLRLDEIGAAVERYVFDANAAFERMLKLNPTSVQALRLYAEFLGEVGSCHCTSSTAHRHRQSSRC